MSIPRIIVNTSRQVSRGGFDVTRKTVAGALKFAAIAGAGAVIVTRSLSRRKAPGWSAYAPLSGSTYLPGQEPEEREIFLSDVQRALVHRILSGDSDDARILRRQFDAARLTVEGTSHASIHLAVPQDGERAVPHDQIYPVRAVWDVESERVAMSLVVSDGRLASIELRVEWTVIESGDHGDAEPPLDLAPGGVIVEAEGQLSRDDGEGEITDFGHHFEPEQWPDADVVEIVRDER